jgi:cystathionine beta-lyase family protein involved in aluminum resistance
MQRREFLRRLTSGAIAVAVAPEVLAEFVKGQEMLAPLEDINVGIELNALWRKAQAELIDAINFKVEHLVLFGDAEPKGRSMVFPVNIGTLGPPER